MNPPNPGTYQFPTQNPPALQIGLAANVDGGRDLVEPTSSSDGTPYQGGGQVTFTQVLPQVTVTFRNCGTIPIDNDSVQMTIAGQQLDATYEANSNPQVWTLSLTQAVLQALPTVHNDKVSVTFTYPRPPGGLTQTVKVDPRIIVNPSGGLGDP